MSVTGTPEGWEELLEQLLPDILQVIVDSWATIKKPLYDNREDTVTTALCKALRQNRNIRDLPVSIQSQMVELDPQQDREIGRLDIVFFPSGLPNTPDESIYFCLECKWLNVIKNGKKQPLGSKYVQQGMLRFVRGQYAQAVRHGCMVGYVLDGDITSAILNVEKNIRSKHQELCMVSPGELTVSSIIPTYSTAKESLHNRLNNTSPFHIHHLFFAADSLFVT
jgi:hypothetical protein